MVSETEVLLKELEQMLQQTLEPTAMPDESKEEHGEEINTGEKVILIVINSNYKFFTWQKLFLDVHFKYMEIFFTSQI